MLLFFLVLNEKAKENILSLAKEMNYQPNHYASNLMEQLPKSGIWYNLLQEGQLELNSGKFVKSLAAGEYYVVSDREK